MGKATFTLTVLMLLAACGKSGASDSTERPSEKTYAQQAVKLFHTACVGTGANEEKLSAWAEQAKLLELDEQQKRQFNFEPEAKRAWGIHSAEGGRFFLVSGKAYCSVKAKMADQATVESEMKALAEQVTDSMGLSKRVVKEGVLPNVPTAKQTVYALEKQGAPSGMMLSVYTDSSPEAGAQAGLNLRFIGSDQ
ncbi:putative lipoprotein [Neisseria animaloris]|uniref:NMCC_0638 family (lipo)protein n=1 Tax=Neisseria animaloris TaxID=326522 RepID=UPI000A191818|nr:hypothetical protein [Neisseria animaloris]OSI08331.1 hypothetical protein BWD08_03660 [Neisseria animaloris]VEH86712.1 putative lipoprotein [Neisseria animaloris]